MRKKVFYYLLTVLMTTCIVMSVKAEKSILLRYQLNKGDKFLLKYNTTGSMEQTIIQQKVNMETETRQVMRWEVLDRTPDGVATIKMSFDSIYIKMVSPPQTIEYDSTKPPTSQSNEPIYKIFEVMKNSTMTLKVNTLGKVLELKGFEEMLEKGIDSVEFPNAEVKKQLKETIKQMFRGKFDNLMVGYLCTYPENKVKIGDTWSSDFAVSIISPMQFQTLNKLTDITNETAIIDIHQTIKPGTKQEPVKMGGITMEFELSGEVTGKNLIEIKTGLIKEGQANYNFTGQIKTQAEPQQGTITIPISMKGQFIVQMSKL
ncbi:MAG: DUF6263 family protein [Candidatus Sumerlaeia bacterium]|nr:DUF6263 family protein [Candidatus Sumerlaeia bacterium]